MASDYEAITRYNEEQLGKDTASRKSQVNMYSDFSHFVYEILQNADDYGATKVSFMLDEDELVIEHNGIPFKEDNVKAISYFGKSTSRDDLVKTGRFGLGFKSVFAFTATPSIHSGDENFQIYDLYRLAALPKLPNLSTNTTRIVLPFNHIELRPSYVEILVDKEKAFNEILDRLQKLDITTLLFTRNVLEIKWIVRDKEGNQKKGNYLRGDKDQKKINRCDQIRKTEITDGKVPHSYLVYSRPIKWMEEDHKPVDIAFYVNKTPGETETIQSSKKPLFVLFPTIVEIHMGFLMNGPFRTPAHRESVSLKDEFNQFLIQEIGDLLCQSMLDIKGKGLLSVGFLNLLPIRMDDFPEDSMFYPIVREVRDALMNEELLPADDGTFVSARSAKLARGAELRKLLSQDQLRALFQSNDRIKWLAEDIPQDRTSDLRLYLMEQLKIEEVRPEKFAELLTDDFLEKQNEKWIINFYTFLGSDRSELWKKPGAVLRKKKIIRLEDNSHVIPFKDDGTPNAYLPSSLMTNFPTIKRSIFADNTAADFLNSLGIIPPDLFAEIIEFVLPKYAEERLGIDSDENIEDLRKIKRLLNEPSQGNSSNSLAKLRILLSGKSKLAELAELAESFAEKLDPGKLLPIFLNFVLPSIKFLRASNGHRTEYKSSRDIYINSDELHCYFQNNSEIWFVCDDYPDEFVSLFNELKINEKPKVTKNNPNNNGFVIISESHSCHERGLSGFDPKIKVDGLENAIADPSRERSLFIWNNIAIPHSACIRGVVEKSRKKTYENSKTENIVSKFGHLLIDKAWLPRPEGGVVRPSKLRLDDLPIGFEKDTPRAKSLSLALEMKQPEREQALEMVTGGDPDFKMLIEHYQSASDDERRKVLKAIPREIPPEPAPSFKDGLKNLGRRQRGAIEPRNRENSPVSNPDRYQEKLTEGVEDAVEDHLSTPRRISFSPVKDQPSNEEARSFLYEQYRGQCQVTGTTFPKASRNTNGMAENYFEACSLLSYTNADYLNDAGNMLCVSADTMAKLKCASFEFLDSLEDTIESFKANTEQTEEVSVRILLADEECSIKWSQRHFMRLVALSEKA